jgi:large subunit ribosomal protein L32e
MIMANKSPKNLKKALEVRAKVASERPDFPRSETHRFPRLGDKWRSSKGIRSKMRLKKRSRFAIVETGYRGPVMARGLHPTGKEEVLVHNVGELEGLNPETQVVRISASSGKKKRLEIKQKAEELKLDILNVRPSEIPKAKEEEPEESETETESESESEESQDEAGADEDAEEPEEGDSEEEKDEEADSK